MTAITLQEAARQKAVRQEAAKMRGSYWLADKPLILASASTARADMLRAAGLDVEIIRAALDERAVEQSVKDKGADTTKIASALSAAKAHQVSLQNPGRWVLGADQTLNCAGEMLHKPENQSDALQQLRKLSGRTHQLVSAATLMRNGAMIAQSHSKATLTMRVLSDEAISLYLAVTGSAVLTSVGGYQLEAHGIQLFEAIEGDHFTILGLPLVAILNDMRKCGVLAK